MVDKKEEIKEELGVVYYTLGILSIIFAFLNPLTGLVIGVVGFIFSRKKKTELSKRGNKLNLTGAIISFILLAIVIALSYYAASVCQTNPSAQICKYFMG